MSKRIRQEPFTEGGIDYEIIVELDGDGYFVFILKNGKKLEGTGVTASSETLRNFGGLDALIPEVKKFVRPRP